MPPSPSEAVGAAETHVALETHLRVLEQGDLISIGAVAIVGTTSSEVTGDPNARTVGVASVTVETPSGWYAVLSQDCDIQRPPDLEPCVTIAPVLYVPGDEWEALRNGLGSYRRYPLNPATVDPIDDEHAAQIVGDLRPVIDIRYVSSLDKTALADHFDTRYPLRGDRKVRFQDWVGSRFSRESFDDTVHEQVLPHVRARLDALQKARRSKGPAASPAMRVASSCSELYVRSTDRYVEVMGRRDPELARSNGLLSPADGTLEWNERDFAGSEEWINKDLAKRVAGTGYTARFNTVDFDTLPATLFETYAVWLGGD